MKTLNQIFLINLICYVAYPQGSESKTKEIPHFKLYERFFPKLERFNDYLAGTRLSQIENSYCFYTYNLGSYIITGKDCSEFPQNNSVASNEITVIKTGIVQLKRDAFSSWPNVATLTIAENTKLKEIQLGAFRGLDNLTILSIIGSPEIIWFHPDTFKELKNLLKLNLLRTGIKSIGDITPALATDTLPNLNYLDVSENHISELKCTDFLPMNDSSLYTFKMTLAKTMNIHPKSFKPVFNVKQLILKENNLNSSVLTSMLQEIRRENISLIGLNLKSNLICTNMKELIQTIADSSISNLDLSCNHITQMAPGTFSFMPTISKLDLSGNMITDFPEGVINITIMPNLTTLQLNGNKFLSLLPSIAISTLKELYLSKNAVQKSYQPTFQIPSDIFLKMPSLEVLDLSENYLYTINTGTFETAKNLIVLLLRKTFLYHIEDLAFINNSKLKFLDLSSNEFPSVTNLTRDIFKGLDNLIGLDLSLCRIANFKDQDLFVYLKNLKFLSLRENSISEIPPRLLNSLENLIEIDLRSNFITSWTTSLFSRIDSMSRIRLSNNRITVINREMIKDFKKLNTVDIANNPILCNCRFLTDIEDENATKSSFLFNRKNNCLTPCMSLSKFVEIALTMNCRGLVMLWFYIMAFTVVFLISLIFLILVHFYKWELTYLMYKIRRKLGCNFKRNKKNTDKKYEFDAFISYSHEDKKFVEKMVAILEGKFNFTICWDMDFQVGDLITESVMESVSSSRTIIMVLTNAFAKSRWCLWEVQIAHQKSMFFRNADPDSIIIIKLSEIDEPLITPSLKHLMKTRLYLKWEPSIMKQKVFWEQLKEAINR